MIVERCLCDECGAEVDDRLTETGWLTLVANSGSLTLERVGSNRVTVERVESRLDFCNSACLKRYVDTMEIAAEVRRKR